MTPTPASADLLAAARDAAARGADYYALLGLRAPSGDGDANAEPITCESVQRAWRRRSLKYHPDKAGAAGFDAARWEEFGLARDVLASDEARAAYDGARAAAMLKRREREAMSARQRRFAEELERAEGGAKRKREENEGREERLQSELKRLARDGERRRREREEAKLREREEEARREEEVRREREREARREKQRERRRQSAGVHFQPGTSVGSAAGVEDGVGTPVKKRVFDGAKSAPSTPAGKKPAFSFSPKPGAGGGNRFEQDTLARLRAKQAEKRKLEEQIMASEAAETTS